MATQGRIITQTKQSRYLNPYCKQLLHLISCEKYHEYGHIISSRLYVRLKGTCSLASRTLLKNDINYITVNCLKITEKHRDSPSEQNAPAGRVFDTPGSRPDFKLVLNDKKCINVKRSMFHTCYSSHVLAQAKSAGLWLLRTCGPQKRLFHRTIKSALMAHNWAEAYNELTTSLIKLRMCRLLFTQC